MGIKEDIISAVGETTISYTALIDTIVRMYGEEGENGGTYMDGDTLHSYMSNLLGEDLTYMANAIHNCPNASKKLNAVYNTVNGGFIKEV
jgi:hypothetical protein